MKSKLLNLRNVGVCLATFCSFLLAGCADDLMNPIPTIKINPGFSTSGFTKAAAVSQNETDVYKVVYTRQYGISRALTMNLTIDESVLNDYNSTNGTSYKLLPAEYYSMPANVKFEIKSKNADFEVTLKSKQIYGFAGSVATAAQYVVPIKAVPETEAGVDAKEETNVILLHVNMQAATVSTVIPESDQNLYFVEESTAKESKSLEANLNFKGIDANAISVIADKNAALPAGDKYKLLPDANYSFGKAVASDNKLTAEIEFNAANLTDQYTYVLPCRFQSSNSDYVVSQEAPVYYIVNITGVEVAIAGASATETVGAYSSLSTFCNSQFCSA